TEPESWSASVLISPSSTPCNNASISSCDNKSCTMNTLQSPQRPFFIVLLHHKTGEQNLLYPGFTNFFLQHCLHIGQRLFAQRLFTFNSLQGFKTLGAEQHDQAIANSRFV